MIYSLAYKVLKGKYFPNSDFLRANKGRDTSYTWRSIIWGRELLLHGLRRRIGNGEDTGIYCHPWLPRAGKFRPLSPSCMAADDPVCLLMKASGGWNEDFIRAHFIDADAEAILSIPLPGRQHQDKWIWHYTTKGHYSVASGYHLATSIQQTEEGMCESASKENMKRYWQKLWSLKVPEKIKFFLWRASKDILPCYANLAKRKIPVPLICPRCGIKEETAIHALFECSFAKQMWKLSPLGPVVSTWKEKSFMDFLDHASWVLTLDEMNLFGFLAWRIWHDRNALVHDKSKFDAQLSYSLVVHCFEEFKAFGISQGRGVKEKQKKWRPPGRGVFKLNCDGAYVPESRVGGAGVVIRNDKGEIAVTQTIPLSGLTTPRHAEILAISYGLQLGLERGFHYLELESDAMAVISAILDEGECLATDGHLLDGIKFLVHHFTSLSCSYVPRECNTVAHKLARFAATHQSPCIWSVNFPSWLIDCTQADLAA